MIQKEDLDDADEELANEDDKNKRNEIISSLFSNSRNLPEKSMNTYNNQPNANPICMYSKQNYTMEPVNHNKSLSLRGNRDMILSK